MNCWPTHCTVYTRALLCQDMSWSPDAWDEGSAQALEAAIHVAAESGMRKVELSSAHGVFSKLDLSFAHLKWAVNGGDPQEPSQALLQALVPSMMTHSMLVSCLRARLGYARGTSAPN